MKPIRVLHFIPGFLYGGIESRFLDWYELIDKQQVQFDLLIQTDKNHPVFNEFKQKGGRVYQIPPLSPFTIRNHIAFLKKLFSENDYAAVHCHSADKSFFVLNEAKKAGVSKRILHARTSSFDRGRKAFFRTILKNLTPPKATDYFAVSGLAGNWLFGRKRVKKVQIIKNAVVSDKFVFNESARKEVREEFNLKNELVIGHVGRFTHQKNHLYLLDIFKKVVEKRPDAILLLIGDGERLEEVKRKVIQSGLRNHVIFTGYRANPEKFYHAMDIFLFPSLFEGLPGSLIEAQVADLFCVVSDTITEEAVILDSTKQLSIEKDPEEWASVLLNQEIRTRRRDNAELAAKAGFDLNRVVRSLQNMYLGKPYYE